MRHALKLLTVMLLSACLLACGSREQRGGPAAASTRDADFVFVTGDAHKHLDPQKISWLSDWRVAACLYEALLVYDAKDLTVRSGVATSWKLSDDKLTYTFELRDRARWSNGDPVTAHDFVYAWRRALLPDMSADYTMLLYHVKGAKAFYDWRTEQLAAYAKNPNDKSPQELYKAAKKRFAATVGVKAKDDATLVVQLERPTPYFLELCAFVTFIPNHRPSLDPITSFNSDTGMIELDPKYWTDPARVVCNGAYVLKRYEFNDQLLMTANNHYWNRSKMKNRAIKERVIDEPQTALLAYLGGEVDWLPELPSTSTLAADLVAQKRHDVHPVSMAGMYFYNFNCNPTLDNGKPNPLHDRRVRQAMSMGIDRQAIVTKVTRLNQPVARSFVPVDAVAGYNPPVDAGIGFNPDKAKRLLADAGHAGGRGLDDLSILYNTGHGHEKIAQVIQRMWEQHLGIKVSLEGIEGKVFASRIKKQQFTICRASWFGDYRDPTTWLGKMHSGDGNNDCAYNNAAYDALLAKAADELDPAARFDILRQAEAVMLQDSPMAMIYQYVNVYVFDPARLQGLHPNPWAIWRLEQVGVRK